MSEPIRFHAEVFAEDAHKYPDMRLRLIIRKAVLDATSDNQMNIDEAVSILRNEVTYIENRIAGAK